MKNKTLLAITVYHESRGEPLHGQIAVAHVILNRCLKRSQSVESVVFSSKQFSCYNDGRPAIVNYDALAVAMSAVNGALEQRLRGQSLEGACYYFATYIDPPSWAKDMHHVVTIGEHTFFRE